MSVKKPDEGDPFRGHLSIRPKPAAPSPELQEALEEIPYDILSEDLDMPVQHSGEEEYLIRSGRYAKAEEACEEIIEDCNAAIELVKVHGHEWIEKRVDDFLSSDRASFGDVDRAATLTRIYETVIGLLDSRSSRATTTLSVAKGYRGRYGDEAPASVIYEKIVARSRIFRLKLLLGLGLACALSTFFIWVVGLSVWWSVIPAILCALLFMLQVAIEYSEYGELYFRDPKVREYAKSHAKRRWF